ncbi:MAG TPA: MlaD family protein [Gammaproteobacteria bacterium]|jgi:paraquat-inducible protein B
MTRRANPTLIGIFILGALGLAVIAALLLAGGDLFEKRREVIMYFDGAAQGLQVGAPVVFLGVRVGTVKQIQLGLDERSQRFMVPVQAELSPHTVQGEGGDDVELGEPETTRELVHRGLRAQLRMQSLLTGQLYVDLDFHPEKPANLLGLHPKISEIPTIPTTVQELASRLESFPVEKFLSDVAAISASFQTIMASAADRGLPARLEATLIHLESLAATLDTRSEPILKDIEINLAAMKQAIATADEAIERMGQAAERVGELARPDSAAMTRINKASDELGQAARAVRRLVEEESPTVYHLNESLQEIARAAHALSMLAEMLERQPESIISGKRSQEDE